MPGVTLAAVVDIDRGRADEVAAATGATPILARATSRRRWTWMR